MRKYLFYGLFILGTIINAQTPDKPELSDRIFDTTRSMKMVVTVYGKGIASNYKDRTSNIQLINMVQNQIGRAHV